MAEVHFHSQKEVIALHDLVTVYRVTYEARNKWQNILLALNVSRATIESIGVRCQSDSPDQCYLEGLSEWLKGAGKEQRRWEDLVKALSSPTVGHSNIAKEIERRYCNTQSTTNTLRKLEPGYACSE